MSRLVPSFLSLVSLLFLLVSPARAQEVAAVGGKPVPAASTGEVLEALTGRPLRPAPTLDVAVVATAGADLGLLGDGDEDRGGAAEGVQAFGTFRLFVGHDVHAADDLTIALGYEGSIGYGRWNLAARQPQDVLVHRHGLAGIARMGFMGVSLSAGVSHAVEPTTGIAALGGSMLAQLAFFAGPVWIGIPVGVDIWPDQGLHSQIFGVNVGFTTM